MTDCGHKANKSSQCTRWPFRLTYAVAPDAVTIIIIIIIIIVIIIMIIIIIIIIMSASYYKHGETPDIMQNVLTKARDCYPYNERMPQN